MWLIHSRKLIKIDSKIRDEGSQKITENWNLKGAGWETGRNKKR